MVDALQTPLYYNRISFKPNDLIIALLCDIVCEKSLSELQLGQLAVVTNFDRNLEKQSGDGVVVCICAYVQHSIKYATALKEHFSIAIPGNGEWVSKRNTMIFMQLLSLSCVIVYNFAIYDECFSCM